MFAGVPPLAVIGRDVLQRDHPVNLLALGLAAAYWSSTIRMANRGGDSTADGSSQEPERDARPQHPRRAAGGHNRRLVNRGEQRCQQHSN
jgi:hypothetical protein